MTISGDVPVKTSIYFSVVLMYCGFTGLNADGSHYSCLTFPVRDSHVELKLHLSWRDQILQVVHTEWDAAWNIRSLTYCCPNIFTIILKSVVLSRDSFEYST